MKPVPFIPFFLLFFYSPLAGQEKEPKDPATLLGEGRFQKAESAFRQTLDKKGENPQTHFKLGKALKRQGKYREAIRAFEKASEESLKKRAEQEIKACKNALEWQKNPVCQVEPVQSLNSPSRDYGPTFADTLYTELTFASHRPTKSQNTGLFHSSRMNYGNWDQPELLDENLETAAEEGPAVIFRKERSLVLTRCQVPAGCNLVRFQKEQGRWVQRSVMDILQPCAPDSINVAHPTYFERERKLFFASDLPGGEGGYDIWYIVYDPATEKWTDPVNAGREMNTAGDELFPYIRENGTLYFSSDGYLTMGGMDIFRSQRKNPHVWEKGENMGYPINSEGNDHGIIFRGDQMRGFFSSDRKREDARGKDDIFRFFLKT